MQKIHLDTDLGGDLDDLCALAMLLRWPRPLQLTGITVVGDTNGRRTRMVRQVLEIAERRDIPVAAGADVAQGYYRYELGLPPEERYWPRPVIPSPNPVEEAVELLRQSVEAGATIIAIGPTTNLYLLDLAHPGILQHANLFLMGGYVHAPRPGFPAWSHRDDFNVQADVRSAEHVLQNSNPTLITLSVTVETALRRAHLDALRRRGDPLAQLLVRQAEAFAVDEGMAAKFGATCAGVPEDIINFHHDPLACAVALGRHDEVTIEEIPLTIAEEENWLIERIDARGKPMRVVTAVDGTGFSDFWLQTIIGGEQ